MKRKITSALIVLLSLLLTGLMSPAVNVSATGASADVSFYVTECIYLKPAGTAEASGQYYLNSFSGDQTTALGRTDAAGHIYFSCPAAVGGTLTYSFSTSGTITGLTTTSSCASLSSDFILSSASNSSGTICWTYTYTDDSGGTRSVTSYTYIYKPVSYPVGVGSEAHGVAGKKGACMGIVSMLWGSTSHTPDSYGGSPDFYIYGSGLFVGTNDLPTKCKMLGTTFTPTSFKFEEFDRAGTVDYLNAATFCVDGSRFSDLDQIPNVRFGLTMSDNQDTSYANVVVQLQKSDGTLIKSMIDTKKYVTEKVVVYNYAGTGKEKDSTVSCDVSGIESHGTANYRIYIYFLGCGTTTSLGNPSNRQYLYFNVINTDKSALRLAYLNALKGSFSRQEGMYTSESWSAYTSALEYAAIELGHPGARDTAGDPDKLTAAINGLVPRACSYSYAVTTLPTMTASGILTGTCAACGGTTTVEIPALNDTDYDVVVKTPAICESAGTSTYTWKMNSTYGVAVSVDAEDIPATGHSWGQWTDNGDGTHTRVCANDPAHTETAAHNWDGGVVTTPATCTAAGVRTFTCAGCGAVKTEAIPATGHSWGQWTDNGGGTHTRVCANDPAHTETAAHNWDEGVVTTPATCTAAGVRTFTCAGCGAVKTEVIPALGHSWGQWTDNGDGTHTRVCANDPAHTETAAHNWDGGIVTTPATCTAAGVRTFTCAGCGAVKTEPIPALGHSWGQWTDNGGGTHTRVCANDPAHTETAPHNWDGGVVTTPATCTAAGVRTFTCAGCGAVKTEAIPALGHSWGQWTDNCDGTHTRVCANDPAHTETAAHNWDGGVVTTPATCTAAGVRTFTCAGCGAVKTEAIPALGHEPGEWTTVKEPACTSAGTKELRCTRCGELLDSVQIDMLPHSYGEWTIVREATIAFEGLRERNCGVCGLTETQVIPALECSRAEDNGVTVSYTGEELSGNISLEAGKLTAGKAYKSVHKQYASLEMFDLEIRKDGSPVVPASEVWVSIPIPAGISPENVRILSVDGSGNTTEVKSVCVNGKVCFETDSSGVYALADTSSSTGNGGSARLTLWQLIVAFFNKVAAFFKKIFGKKS